MFYPAVASARLQFVYPKDARKKSFFYKVTLPEINKAAIDLLDEDAHCARCTRINENTGLTISAKPASVVAGTTRLELATSGVTKVYKNM